MCRIIHTQIIEFCDFLRMEARGKRKAKQIEKKNKKIGERKRYIYSRGGSRTDS